MRSLFLLFLCLYSSVNSYDPSKQYNLLVADNAISSIEEFRGDTFELNRKIQNTKFFQVRDVKVKDGYIFTCSGYGLTVEVFEESSLEHVTTLLNFTDDNTSPFALRWINDDQLVVITDSSSNNEVRLYNISMEGGISAVPITSVVRRIYDLVQRPDTKELLVVTADFYNVEVWNSSLIQIGTFLGADAFPGAIPYWIDWNDGTAWIAVQDIYMDIFTFWQVNPAENMTITLSNSTDLFVVSFLFEGNDSIIVFGSYSLPYITNYYKEDSLIIRYDITSGIYSYFTDPELNHLGYLRGSSWDSSGNFWVADYSRIRKFTTAGVQIGDITEYKGFVEPRGLCYSSSSPRTATVSSMNRIMAFDLNTFNFTVDIVESMFWDADGDTEAANGITCDDEGSIYVASFLGAVSYTSQGINNTNENLLGNQTQEIALAPDGKYWISYDNVFIAIMNPTTGEWQTDLNPTFPNPHDVWHISFLSEDNTEGTVYLAGFQNVSSFTWPDFDPITRFNAPPQVEIIYDMEVGPDGNIYLLTRGGVARLDPDLSNLETLTSPRPFSTAGTSIAFIEVECNCESDQTCSYGTCIPRNPSNKRSDSTIAIVVGVVLGVAALAAGVAAMVVWRRRSHNKELQKTEEQGIALETNQEPKRASQMPMFKSFDSHWEIDYTELKIGENIGSGAFGAVYKAKYRNSDCVVKQMKNSENRASMDNFLKEAHTVIRVKPHKNICFLFGVCTNPSYPTCIVMEYVNGGSLQSLLLEERIELNLKNLLKIFKDVVSGMSHLHHEGLLHCDLACRNLLVSLEKDSEFTIKLADFGLARFTETGTYDASVNSIFPVRWSAPEVLQASKLSKASDVWSFGIVMWEIIQGTAPYLPLTNQEVIEHLCVQKQILPPPTRIKDLPADFYDCMKSCWAFKPGNRPNFDGLYETLEDLETSLFGIEKGVNQKTLDNSNDAVTGNPLANFQMYGNQSLAYFSKQTGTVQESDGSFYSASPS